MLPFNYSMDSGQLPHFTHRFWCHYSPSRCGPQAVCGGAQGGSAPGEVPKMYVFFGCCSQMLRKCSGLDLVSQGTCLPTLYTLAKIEFRCANFKFGMATPRKQPRNAQIITFHQIRYVQGEKSRCVMDIFLSASGSVGRA